jgi:very-short-patch-repair endonuclease
MKKSSRFKCLPSPKAAKSTVVSLIQWKRSHLELLLESQLKTLGLNPVQEYRFNELRRWRFDLAFPLLHVAVEVEGGTWGRSRHTSGAGFEKDCIKYNAAALQGWSVLRYTARMIKDGTAAKQVLLMVRARTP